MSTAVTAERQRVLDALAAVRDPELDEPITTLGFVTYCEVREEGEVELVLRLPTPQCAPNFAFLMASDARAAARRVPGVGKVKVTLEDHYTEREINGALERDQGFGGAFPGETADELLEGLRELFLRKALVARESRLCEALLAGGASAEEVTRRRLDELPDLPDTRRCEELRRQLGLSSAPDAPAFVLPDGQPISSGELPRWLRTARLVRMSLEVNGGICRSLLQVRHGVVLDDPEEVSR
jgi:metal-sulfur cluster biosynthetic enzyme